MSAQIHDNGALMKILEYSYYSRTQDAIIDYDNPFDPKFEVSHHFLDMGLIIKPENMKYYLVIEKPMFETQSSKE